MRLRFGVCMPRKGGRTAVVGVEVRESRGPDGRLVHAFTVGSVDRVQPFSVEAARDRVTSLVATVADVRPCVIIDVGTPQGLALRQEMRDRWSRDLHRPHAYPGVGDRAALFASFLQAYSAGRVTFAPGLPHRADLDRALIFYMGTGKGRKGKHDSGQTDVELSSEDEALVIALGLAMFWPRHGPSAASL